MIHYTRNISRQSHLYDRRLGAGGKGVGQTALAAVLAIVMESHLQKGRIGTKKKWPETTYEDTGTALCGGALTTETLDLAV